MAGLVSGDVTYTVLKKRKLDDSRKYFQVQIAFGDGAKTYPAGGVPLLKGSFGCPNDLESLNVVDTGGSGYQFKFDKANVKLRIFEMAAHAHDILLKDAVQADGATSRVNAAANKLGANTGGDITVAGAGANGGVRNSVPGALGELGTSEAPAAQTLIVEVIGW